MGRVIKFKAKRLDNGEWEEGSLLLSERGKVCIGTMLDSNEENGTPVCFKCREVDPATVCQYTGLKDKEGMDIFEGDLLYDEDSGIVSAIKWKRNICGYVYEKAGAFATMRVFSNHTCFLKVIGNKFNKKESKK